MITIRSGYYPPNPPRASASGRWMAISSGWLFRVHGYLEGSYFNSKRESQQGRAQTESMQEALTASVGHCTFCLVTMWRRLQESPRRTAKQIEFQVHSHRLQGLELKMIN